MAPVEPHWYILRFGEQVGKLVDGELVKFSRASNGIEDFRLSSLVEMGLYVAVDKCVRIGGSFIRVNLTS